MCVKESNVEYPARWCAFSGRFPGGGAVVGFGWWYPGASINPANAAFLLVSGRSQTSTGDLLGHMGRLMRYGAQICSIWSVAEIDVQPVGRLQATGGKTRGGACNHAFRNACDDWLSTVSDSPHCQGGVRIFRCQQEIFATHFFKIDTNWDVEMVHRGSKPEGLTCFARSDPIKGDLMAA